MARAPPSVAAAYPAFKPLTDSASSNDVMLTTLLDTMVTWHFLFGRREMAVLQRLLPARFGRRCTEFQLLAATLWWCRTAALPTPHTSDAGDLCSGTLGQTVELVCEARLRVREEYVRSTVDLMALLRGRDVVFDGVYMVSDLTWLFAELDFGHGEWVVSGMAQPMLATFLVRCRNADGEDAVAASMLLPPPVMERFAEELAGLMMRLSSKHDKVSGRRWRLGGCSDGALSFARSGGRGGGGDGSALPSARSGGRGDSGGSAATASPHHLHMAGDPWLSPPLSPLPSVAGSSYIYDVVVAASTSVGKSGTDGDFPTGTNSLFYCSGNITINTVFIC
uniref:Uncharacterized protein n=1 Tax=Oryza nivara TaxID=4536 RepID=A0A0E0INY3_ORYNI